LTANTRSSKFKLVFCFKHKLSFSAIYGFLYIHALRSYVAFDIYRNLTSYDALPRLSSSWIVCTFSFFCQSALSTCYRSLTAVLQMT